MGLVNTSDELWTVTLPSGTQRTVAHGDSMPARTGFKIKFGNLGETAEIN